MKVNLAYIVKISLIMGFFFGVGAKAQDELDSEVYDSEQIDIDGNFNRRELLERRRKKLREQRDAKREERRLVREERQEARKDRLDNQIENIKAENAEKIDKKIGKLRYENEKNLLKKLFDKEDQKGEVKPSRVAPVPAAPIAQAPPQPRRPIEEEEEQWMSQLSFNFGGSKFSGENIDVESDTSFSMRIEGNYNGKFSLGVSVGITNMGFTINDDNFIYYAYEPYDRYYGNRQHGERIGQAEVDYRRITVELVGKAYLFYGGRFRPYIGFGLGYNRVSLDYEEEEYNFHYQPYDDYDEETAASEHQFSGLLGLGTEFLITEVVGIDVNFQYRKALSSSFQDARSDSDADGYIEYYESILKNLGEKLEDSNELSLNVGITVHF